MGNPFKSNPRIFVVDDEVQIAKMLVVILQMNMFDAVPYSDPEAALQAAKQDPPDYLISDVVMSGIDGIQLAIAIRKEIPACKVLLFSGQVGAPELIEKAKEAGHRFELVQKPIHPKSLVETLLRL
jgi:DNA-binding NtrC family response regulator